MAPQKWRTVSCRWEGRLCNRPLVLAAKMVDCFNHWHNLAIQNGHPGGHGGYVTQRLVEGHLKEPGRAAVHQQVSQRVRQPVPQPARPTQEQLDSMGRQGLREVARVHNLVQKAPTVEALRKRLKEHFKNSSI